MDILKVHTPDVTAENIEKVAALFPNCITEMRGADGKLTRALDYDQLRQELSSSIVEGPRERYHLDWPGKREALLAANAPIAKTLRPCHMESVDFDTTRNLFIEGDNLDALKLLQETYLNKVKMIYIDPPYNTGKEFIYDDDFKDDTETYFKRSNQKDSSGIRMVANTEANGRFHSDWLTMMYPRLKLARNLLRLDGVIFISIDDGEVANLRRLCDEVFGEDNFIANIVWQKAYAPRNNAPNFSVSHDHIICYSRSTCDSVITRLGASQEQRARYYNRDHDPRGDWKPGDMTVSLVSGQRGRTFQTSGKGANLFEVTSPSGRHFIPSSGRCWVYSEAKFNELNADNRIWWGEDGNNMPSLKRFWDEIEGGQVCQTIWTYQEVGHNQSASKELKSLFPEQSSPAFPTPKPRQLIERMCRLTCHDDDLVLDFFAGSATTADAVMALNAEDSGTRRYIMVQLADLNEETSEAFRSGFKTIAEIAKERIRRAGAKIKAESALTAPDLDIGFRVLRIDTSNMKDVYYAPDVIKQADLLDGLDNIREDRTPEDLLLQVLVDWGVDLGLPIVSETLAGKAVFFVDGNALAACFDTDITEDLVKELAKRKPLRAVFRDSGYGSDSVKINVEQIFKLLSPGTEIKSL